MTNMNYYEEGDFSILKVSNGSSSKSSKLLQNKSRGGGKHNSTKSDAKKNKKQEVYSSKHVRIAAEKRKKNKLNVNTQ